MLLVLSSAKLTDGAREITGRKPLQLKLFFWRCGDAIARYAHAAEPAAHTPLCKECAHHAAQSGKKVMVFRHQDKPRGCRLQQFFFI
jgi:hypothetical protein